MEHDDKNLRQALDAWRDSAQRGAERPEWFWARQRARVMSEIRKPRISTPYLAWASLAATVALALGLLLPGRPQQPVVQQQLQVAEQRGHVEISDHDLMVALERTMNSGVPASLEPATLIARDMTQALNEKDQSQKAKEKNYED